MYILYFLSSKNANVSKFDRNVPSDIKSDTPGNQMSGSLSSLDGEIPNVLQDDSMKSDSASSDTHYNSFLCMAIRDPDENVLGVISLIDKEPGDGGGIFGQAPLSPISASGGHGYFTENDEQFVKAFSIFCGMAIR